MDDVRLKAAASATWIDCTIMLLRVNPFTCSSRASQHIVSMLVELANATVDVLWNALVTSLKKYLSYGLGEQHVLVGVLLQHPLQEEGSPRLLQLCPVLLAGFVKLVLIGDVPDWLDVELLHLFFAASVDATVIEEKVELVVIAS